MVIIKAQVFKDFKNSWKILKKGGIMIFDDYIWKFFEKLRTILVLQSMNT